MDPIFRVFTSVIAFLVLLVLVLGLLCASVWLLRLIGRLWSGDATTDRRQ